VEVTGEDVTSGCKGLKGRKEGKNFNPINESEEPDHPGGNPVPRGGKKKELRPEKARVERERCTEQISRGGKMTPS